MNPEPPLEKILRQELETSEKRYRQLFESAREGILIFDAATGRITAANRYLAELLDYLPGDLLEKRPWEFGLFSEGTPAEAALQKLEKDRDAQAQARDARLRAETALTESRWVAPSCFIPWTFAR